jgi:TetR/AcrR family transcriptional regulator, cholesterol catabolism regulator
MPGRDTRQVLLRRAAELFSKKGYADTSIADIGSKARMANSLFYHYFKTKEEVLFETIITTGEELLGVLKEVQRRETSDPVECFRNMIREHLLTFGVRRKAEAIVVVEQQYWLTPKHKEAVRNLSRQIYDLYIDKFKEIQAAGQLTNLDLPVVAYSVFASITWFFHLYREGGKLSSDEIVEQIIRLLLFGIIKR